jgi:hypothetical protein
MHLKFANACIQNLTIFYRSSNLILVYLRPGHQVVIFIFKMVTIHGAKMGFKISIFLTLLDNF